MAINRNSGSGFALLLFESDVILDGNQPDTQPEEMAALV